MKGQAVDVYFGGQKIGKQAEEISHGSYKKMLEKKWRNNADSLE